MRGKTDTEKWFYPSSSTLHTYGASALSGVLLFVSFPKPNWNLFAWIACSSLLAAIVTERRLYRTFLYGYLSGAVFLGGSCYWFVRVMQRYGGLSPLLAVGVLVLFVLIFSFFFGLYGLVEGWTARKSAGLALLLSPFLWVCMELARTYLLTGFPWNLLGYAVQSTGLRRLASFTAVYGLSFVAVTTSALLAWIFLNPRAKGLKVALACWFVGLLISNRLLTPSPLPQGSSLAVLVQPDTPLGEAALASWDPSRNPVPLEGLVAMTVGTLDQNPSATSPLLVWSENSAPFYFQRDPIFRQAVESMAREARAYAAVGTVTFANQAATQPKNSAVVLDPNGELVFQYDKIHLVPFGEYVPRWAFPSKVGRITAEVGDFVPGSIFGAARTPGGALSILICYEAIFPQLVRRLVPNGQGVMINISNDAWYGNSSAAFQHLEMARLRAIENGRYLLRATNDGITAVIDPYGRVLQQLPRHRRMALAGHFDYLAGRTFYHAHGDVFGWFCVGCTIAMLVFTAANRQENQRAKGKMKRPEA